MRLRRWLWWMAAAMWLTGCATPPPLPTEEEVEAESPVTPRGPTPMVEYPPVEPVEPPPTEPEPVPPPPSLPPPSEPTPAPPPTPLPIPVPPEISAEEQQMAQ